MRRKLASVFVFGVICFTALAGSNAPPASAGGGDQEAILKADNALQLALKKKDSKALAALLDRDFSWTDEDGHTRTTAKFLRDSTVAAPDSETQYADLQAHDYGHLAVVTGTSKHAGNLHTFFARVWVKQTTGWLLLTHQDTAIVSKDSPSPSAPPARGNTVASASDTPGCENPCRTVPYKPKTAEQKEVLEAYQAVETAVTSHDAKTWAYHVADEFVGIGRRYTGTPDTKAGRVGQIGIVTNRVVLPRMLWGEAFVFGDAAILIANHQPEGEPAYRVIRVWVKRDGRWQLFHRQETTIKKTDGSPKAS